MFDIIIQAFAVAAFGVAYFVVVLCYFAIFLLAVGGILIVVVLIVGGVEEYKRFRASKLW